MKTSIKTKKERRWFVYFNKRLVDAYGFPANLKRGYSTLAIAKSVATKALRNFNISPFVFWELKFRQKFV